MQQLYEIKQKKYIKWGVIGLVILILVFLLKPFTVVNSGNRGLRFTMGKLHNVILDEGIHFKIPLLQTIKEVTIRPIELKYEIVVGQYGAITKDNQNIGADITMFYRYKPEQLVEMWRKIGEENMKNINKASIKQGFKKEIGEYTIFEVAPIQEIIRANILEQIRIALNEYPIEVTELKITNYDWPDSFEKQIEQTMERAQQVKQKEQDLLIAEQEAQKQVKQAEAKKTAMITEAEGAKEAARLMAEAKALEGEGIRKYNQSVQQNMGLEIELRKLEIERIKAERWNGQYVPNNMYGPIPVSHGGVQK